MESDLGVLSRMETEGARFSPAVKLDSASTFECIVEETALLHGGEYADPGRASGHELCYRLRFRNPHDPTDYFDVDSLVEAMALLARQVQAPEARADAPLRRERRE